MTSKTKLGIFSMAAIVAVAAISLGFVFNDEIQMQSIGTSVAEPYVKDATPLHLQEHRSGIAVMSAIEVENPRLDNINFQELKSGQFDFIWRAINNGATYVSDGELKIYSEQIKEPNHRFVIADGESVKYYRTSITTPPISYENHYIKVLEFAEERSIDFKPLDNTSRTSISEQLERPYRWILVDEPTALSTTSMRDSQGTFFSSENSRGTTEFQIQYLGPLGEEFQTNSELADLLQEAQEQKLLEVESHE